MLHAPGRPPRFDVGLSGNSDAVHQRPRNPDEFTFNEWTSDKKLRAPIFQGFRDDVNPEDCRLEESIPEPSPEFQGRTPNSEVQEFGVRPWNSHKNRLCNTVQRTVLTNIFTTFRFGPLFEWRSW